MFLRPRQLNQCHVGNPILCRPSFVRPAYLYRNTQRRSRSQSEHVASFSPWTELPHFLSARHDSVFQNRCSGNFDRNILSTRRAFIAYQEKSLLVAVFQLGAKFGRLLHCRPPPFFRFFQVQQSRLPLALTYCKPQGYENRDCTDTYGNNFGGQSNTLTSTCRAPLYQAVSLLRLVE